MKLNVCFNIYKCMNNKIITKMNLGVYNIQSLLENRASTPSLFTCTFTSP